MYSNRPSYSDGFAERDRKGCELKRRLSLAERARNKVEIRRIRAQLKFWGIPA